MSSAAPARPSPDAAPLTGILVAQTRSTLLHYWRVPVFFVFSMALPVMFYLFFGLPFAHEKLPFASGAGPNASAGSPSETTPFS